VARDRSCAVSASRRSPADEGGMRAGERSRGPGAGRERAPAVLHPETVVGGTGAERLQPLDVGERPREPVRDIGQDAGRPHRVHAARGPHVDLQRARVDGQTAAGDRVTAGVASPKGIRARAATVVPLSPESATQAVPLHDAFDFGLTRDRLPAQTTRAFEEHLDRASWRLPAMSWQAANSFQNEFTKQNVCTVDFA
jgi:hypothetical protein